MHTLGLISKVLYNREGVAPYVVWGRYGGALVLLYSQEPCNKNHWFESVSLKFRVYFIPTSP